MACFSELYFDQQFSLVDWMAQSVPIRNVRATNANAMNAHDSALVSGGIGFFLLVRIGNDVGE